MPGGQRGQGRINNDDIGGLLLLQVLSAEVHSKVVEAFEVFDHENNKTVDVREVSQSPLCISIVDIPDPDWNNHTISRPLSQ